VNRALYVCLDRGVPVGGTKGASIHVGEMIRALAAEGCDVTLLARRVEASPPDATALPVTAVDGSFRFVPNRALRRDLREVAARPRFRATVNAAIAGAAPSFVYERYALFRTEATTAARRAGIPVVLEVNAPLVEEERRFRSLALRRLAERAERRAWSAADIVVVPSTPLGRRVEAVRGRPVLVAPNAVDPAVFSPADPDRELRTSLGLDGRFVVGFAGSLKAWHDLGTVVEAVAALGADGALLLVGEGPDRAAVSARCERSGVRAAFTGAVPHDAVARYLALADACVASLTADPSLDYFSPLKALEYMACGRPAVVALAGDLRALVERQVAVGYRAGDAADLAGVLRRLAEDPRERERLGAAGRAHAVGWTWRDVARQVLQTVASARSASATA